MAFSMKRLVMTVLPTPLIFPLPMGSVTTVRTGAVEM